ncbi:MAG: hypothetical protein ACYC54_14990 [Sedimentisphaerales bacterium]
MNKNMKKFNCKIKEQCSDIASTNLKVNVLFENGKIWIQPEGYGDKTSADGHGYPIGIEIWQGKLRLVIFDDIESEIPQIIDLETAKESNRSLK